MKYLLSLVLLLFVSAVAAAQTLATEGVGAPSGSCSNATYTNLTTGQHYSCVAGSWSLDPTGSVPDSRTIAGHALTSNVSVSASDVGAVPTSTTVNGHALSSNVTVSASDVNLGNVSNTSDANKPVSTAQQAALDLKAPLASPTFTGPVKLTPVAISALPTCNAGAIGSMAIVTDALLPAFLATVAAGGSVKVPVFCDGSNWIVH